MHTHAALLLLYIAARVKMILLSLSHVLHETLILSILGPLHWAQSLSGICVIRSLGGIKFQSGSIYLDDYLLLPGTWKENDGRGREMNAEAEVDPDLFVLVPHLHMSFSCQESTYRSWTRLD